MYEIRCHDPRYANGYPHKSGDDLESLKAECDALNAKSEQEDGSPQWWITDTGVIIYPSQFVLPQEDIPAPGTVWMVPGFSEGVHYFLREPVAPADDQVPTEPEAAGELAVRSPEDWQAFPVETRRAAWTVAVLTEELQRPPTAEEVNEALTNLDSHLDGTVVHLEELAALGFVQESYGSWQVHPGTLKLLAKGQWKREAPRARLRNDLVDQADFEGVDELVPWWYGDTVRIVQPDDNFSLIGAVTGDVVILRSVERPDRRCFLLFATRNQGMELRRWEEARENWGGTQLVAHIHLYGGNRESERD